MATMGTTTRSTATTTRAEGPPGKGARLVSGLALVLGGVLLFLAVPRTIAAWEASTATRALMDLSWRHAPKPDDVAAGISGLTGAIRWIRSAEYLGDLGTLEMQQALQAREDEPRRTEAAARAERDLVEALRLNPANGLYWMRLAWIREMLERPKREIASCLIQSLDMAPNERGYWVVRARFLMAYWSQLTAEEAVAASRQFQMIWKVAPGSRKELVTAARDLDRMALLQWSLGDDPVDQAELKKLTQP